MVKSPLSLYFHIPFCTKKCPYCHFYVIPDNQSHKELLLESLLLEWNTLLPKIAHHEIVSIYFGGGTPALFGALPIAQILTAIQSQSLLSPDCEITLEANPENITASLMQGYRKAGINRVSIGVQSLEDKALLTLGRTHNAHKALDAIQTTYDAGITNISIDLMYELPNQKPAHFKNTLSKLADLPISHLSLYNLTIEPHTGFYKKKETLSLPSDDEGLQMLNAATTYLESIGLHRYEISAFAKSTYHSRHNTGYWTARPFFGLGPSAFSYYEGRRFRNIANINRYAKALKNAQSPIDFEECLSYPQNIHELLIIHLRLISGINLTQFDLPLATHSKIKALIKEGYLEKKEPFLRLTEKGLLFYDAVASELLGNTE